MKNLIYVSLVLFALSACYPEPRWKQKVIEAKETSLMQKARAGTIDTNDVFALLKVYEDYASQYPDDTSGADYLFKAADFYRYMDKPMRSIQLYGKIYSNYSSMNRRSYALFLQGFIYENEVGDVEAAKLLYKKFLKEYPNHRIAKDVQLSLDNLGKSPEETLNELIAKQKADSTAQAQ